MIVVRAGTFEIACATEPLGGTGVRDEVVCGSRYRRSFHFDSYPERSIRSRGRAEDLTFVIPDLPIAAIGSQDQWCFEIHRQINTVSRSNFSWERHKILSAHEISADQHNAITCFPCTGSTILQAPDFCERRARSKDRVIRNSEIGYKLYTITTAIRSWCRGQERGPSRGARAGRRSCRCTRRSACYRRSEGRRARRRQRRGKCPCAGRGSCRCISFCWSVCHSERQCGRPGGSHCKCGRD